MVSGGTSRNLIKTPAKLQSSAAENISHRPRETSEQGDARDCGGIVLTRQTYRQIRGTLEAPRSGALLAYSIIKKRERTAFSSLFESN
jgi:hypothetical protein